MTNYTKKWKKSFEKKYSSAISQLQLLENEYKQMILYNTDTWISLYPSVSDVEFGKCDGYYVSHFKDKALDENSLEHVNISLKSELGMFSFNFESYEQLKEFRNKVIEVFDKFGRPVDTRIVIDDECEDDEGWEENEESEYIIQASRSCVQTWTHTVMARSSCEAYRKLDEDEGSTHDENDEYEQYGEITWELI